MKLAVNCCYCNTVCSTQLLLQQNYQTQQHGKHCEDHSGEQGFRERHLTCRLLDGLPFLAGMGSLRGYRKLYCNKKQFTVNCIAIETRTHQPYPWAFGMWQDIANQLDLYISLKIFLWTDVANVMLPCPRCAYLSSSAVMAPTGSGCWL